MVWELWHDGVGIRVRGFGASMAGRFRGIGGSGKPNGSCGGERTAMVREGRGGTVGMGSGWSDGSTML